MASLVAAWYPELRLAEQAHRAMVRLTVERVLEVEDAVLVTRDATGRVLLSAPMRGTRLGVVLLGPALGADEGDFVRRLSHALDGGGAALVVLLRRSTPETLLARLADYDGIAFHTVLDAAAEDRLRRVV
jgi:uncharacterized membrane protein